LSCEGLPVENENSEKLEQVLNKMIGSFMK